MSSGIHLSKVLQLDIFDPHLSLSHHIIPTAPRRIRCHLTKPIVRQLVHQAFFQGWGSSLIDPIASSTQEIVFFDMRVDTTSDPDHPNELVDVIP